MTDELDAFASAYVTGNTFDLENQLILNWYPRRIQRLLKERPMNALELGIGHGYSSTAFKEMSQSYVAVEGSQAVITNFLASNPDFSGNVVLERFETFQPETLFDVIVMGFILEHVDEPLELVQRYKGFLNRNGRMFIAVPNAKSLNRRLGHELGLLPDIYSLNQNDLALGHRRQFCVDTLRTLIETAGMKIRTLEGIYLKPLPLSVLSTLDRFEENLEAMLNVGIGYPDLCVAILAEVEVE